MNDIPRQRIDSLSHSPLGPHGRIRLTARYFKICLSHFGKTPELRAQILEGTDCADDELGVPDAEITLEQQYRQYLNLTALFGHGYTVASPELWGYAAHGQTVVANQCAPSLLEALRTLERYGVDADRIFGYRLGRDGEDAKFRYETKVPLPEGYERASLEIGYIGFRSLLYIYVLREPHEVEYHFRCSPPAHADQLSTVLTGTVSYGAPENAIVFPAKWLAREPTLRNDRLYEAVRVQLEAVKGRFDGSLVERVEALLAAHPTGRSSLPAAATHLGLSPRSLTRHLSAAGVTFRALTGAEQERRVQTLAGSGLKLSDVAERLGYSDVTSLARARRRRSLREPRSLR